MLAAISLTFALACLLGTVAAVNLAWPRLRSRMDKWHPALAADAAFLLESSPLLIAFAMPLLFVLPGFMAWEPQRSRELIPVWMLALATLAGLLLAFGVVRFLVLLVGGRCHLQRLVADVQLRRLPFVAAVGWWRPRIWCTESAQQLFDEEQLRAVLAHERAHIARQDNARELCSLMLSSLLPFWGGLRQIQFARRTWSEQAADLAAVHDSSGALHLAAALVKFARNTPPAANPFVATFAPEPASSCLAQRISRLVTWEQTGPTRRLHAVMGGLFVVCAVLVGLAAQSSVQYAAYRLVEKLVAL